jgi:hypothetical protein
MPELQNAARTRLETLVRKVAADRGIWYMVYGIRQDCLIALPRRGLPMTDQTKPQAGQTQGRQLVRSHYLVAVEEKRLSIGRFGLYEGVKGAAVVDVGNAKDSADAQAKAVARFAKAKHLNPILVSVTEVRQVKAEDLEQPEAKFSVTTDLARLAKAVGTVATCGSLTIKVRGA